MKIGIDARFWNETGVGRYTRNLVECLGSHTTKNEYVLFLRPQEYKTLSLPGTNFTKVLADIPWHSLKEQILFPRIIEKEHLDLMHFPYFAVPIAYHKPYVVTIHDLILHHFATGEATTLPNSLYLLKLLGYKYVIKRAAQHAKKIITVSGATKQEIVDHLGVTAEKVAITYEGLSFASSSTSVKNTYGDYFLHVGNVYPHKNSKRLVDAFIHAFKDKEVTLIFVGKKDFFMKRLMEFVKKGKSPNKFIFLDSVDDEQLSGLYTHAKAVVIPSLMEGFGLPAIEAMAAGSLVIASEIPSLREVTGGNAVFCDPNNIQDIAAKLKAVYDAKPNKYEVVKQKGEQFVARYSWRKMTEETITIYENCLSQKS